MSVSQKDIADRLGLSRTTVTKILNRDPRYSAAQKTRELVYRAAEEMGYDFTSIRRPYKREYGRIDVDLPCQVGIFLDNGVMFDYGQAVARNISPGGALLADLNFKKMVLPLEPFKIKLAFPGIGALSELVSECQVARISDAQVIGKPELGVRFINIKPEQSELLRDYVSQAAGRRSDNAASADLNVQ